MKEFNFEENLSIRFKDSSSYHLDLWNYSGKYNYKWSNNDLSRIYLCFDGFTLQISDVHSGSFDKKKKLVMP
jgi:hypothetical protein